MNSDAWRRWGTRLVPPILLGRGGSAPIWQGVYPRLADVPVSRNAYSAELIEEMVSAVEAALGRWRSGRKPFLWHEPMALVAATIAAPTSRLRVIDFGGSVGSGFAQLITSLPPSIALDYLVIDNEEMCAAGGRLFDGESRIRFAVDLPQAADPDVDLIYVNSVLQYIDDYRAILTRLASMRAGAIFLARLAAGDQPTFASRQLNVPGRVFPYWFLNMTEVVQTLGAAGYVLACDSFAEQVYDHRNLPATHRVERFRNALFVRQGPLV